jgi:hypothetical protein
MRKRQVFLTVFVVAALAAAACWLVEESALFSEDSVASLKPIWPFVVGGLLAVGALTAALMSLAFYSSRRGYDEPADPAKPREPEEASPRR